MILQTLLWKWPNTEHSNYYAPKHKDVQAHLSQASLPCQVFPPLFSTGMWDSCPVICYFSYIAGGHCVWEMSSGEGRGLRCNTLQVGMVYIKLECKKARMTDTGFRNPHEVCEVIGIIFNSESDVQWVYAKSYDPCFLKEQILTVVCDYSGNILQRINRSKRNVWLLCAIHCWSPPCSLLNGIP